jgi:hypothetical protein
VDTGRRDRTTRCNSSRGQTQALGTLLELAPVPLEVSGRSAMPPLNALKYSIVPPTSSGRRPAFKRLRRRRLRQLADRIRPGRILQVDQLMRIAGEDLASGWRCRCSSGGTPRGVDADDLDCNASATHRQFGFACAVGHE